MEFQLLDISIWDDRWWIEICGVHGYNTRLMPAFSVLYIERGNGTWKFDLLGLRGLYYWWKDRGE